MQMTTNEKQTDDRTIDEIFASIVKINEMKAELEAQQPEAEQKPAGLPRPEPFRTKGLHPCVKEALDAMDRWASDVVTYGNPHWLTLFGRSGCGKTHLLKLAQYVLRQGGHQVIYRNWPAVMDEIIDGEWGHIAVMCRAKVLILDDIGAGYMAAGRRALIAAAKLYEIMEARLGRWTLLASNLAPQDISDRVDPRIASRLYRGDNQLVDMRAAGDYAYSQYMQRRNG